MVAQRLRPAVPRVDVGPLVVAARRAVVAVAPVVVAVETTRFHVEVGGIPAVGVRRRLRDGRLVPAVRAVAARVDLVVHFLEERVRFEGLANFLLELDGGQLQQPDRLLELRRDGEVLTQPQVK